MRKPKILVFASGSASGGGSGFENLVHRSRDGTLDAEVVGVVSNHRSGGVAQKAAQMGIPFYFFGPPWSGVGYVLLARESEADFFALSGWLKPVQQLNPALTFNIHPGPLPIFGGPGMYGHRVHERVLEAYRCGVVTHSAVCMHFVTEKYDEGPCFFRCCVRIFNDDSAGTLGARVNACEHRWQPEITNLIVHREITWDGNDPQSLRCPRGYWIARH